MMTKLDWYLKYEDEIEMPTVSKFKLKELIRSDNSEKEFINNILNEFQTAIEGYKWQSISSNWN